MPLQQTSGAASYDAFGGGAPVAAKYIEDFFQTWLRTGTGSSTTVTTGLNGAINETMVWTKSRSAATNHKLTDNVRGATKALSSNTTGAEVTDSQGLTAFSSTGYTIGTNTDYNNSGATYVDGQFVATPKFFDVVTYTGNGSDPQTISHNLGSVPGCMIVKRTDSSTNGSWYVYHRSLTTPSATATNNYLLLNTTDASVQDNGYWGFGSSITATTFQVNNQSNANGATYVAYLFAHNAGGFGLSGTDNVISCGSFTTDGSGNATVDLGYEPQWLTMKSTTASSNWWHVNNMAGFVASPSTTTRYLTFNTSNAEQGWGSVMAPTATGFVATGLLGSTTYIYIAIRRGPMRTPTSGTSVFSPNLYTEIIPTGTELTAPFPTDLNLVARRNSAQGFYWLDRLRGSTTSNNALLTSFNTSAEFNFGVTTYDFANNTGVKVNFLFNNTAASTVVDYQFRRAPGFFDEVCYTGTYTNRTVAHNLAAAPQLMIIKNRSAADRWSVYSATVGPTGILVLNTTAAADTSPGREVYWNNTAPTASVFSLGPDGDVNNSGANYVAYLFASAPGVSRVGSYTGTGATQTINCGFTGGARFVLIKRTDSTGDWYVWDSARGIVAGNDPYLLLNSTAAEVTSTDFVDTAATGFELSSTAPAALNASGGTFLFLAIA